jgi:cytochrome b
MAMAEYDQIRIWDIWVRLFHWTLAVSVLFLLISGETGWQFFDWHRTVGELALTLIVFRLLWGLAGSSNARLRHLVRHPKSALMHLADLFRRTPHQERGHNAAGSWAVLALLLIVGTQAVTGLFIADEDEFVEGALYGSLSSANTDLVYRIHMLNAQLLQIIVIVHVVMVFVYLLYARQNLIRPMITGWMKWPASVTMPDVRFQRSWVGALLAAVSAALIGFVVGWY